ncbi:MAG: hypothetical protein JOY91_15760 [Sinobacteraceae bacterium]|nr:hypothetical protein [Nevskiaceae bacterium]
MACFLVQRCVACLLVQRCVACLLLLLGGSSLAHAIDWELDADGRLISSNGERSFTSGGLGTLRYDAQHSGLQLGRARLALAETFAETWSAHLDASAWGDDDRSPVDLTEAYLQFRPYPFGGYRLRIKGGAFYAPISLENRAAGWESPYTLSYSALNTWIGEELRTIGAEAQLEWLGTRLDRAFDAGITLGVFGRNEGAGTVLADRGFSLSDRQTTLFGRVGSTISSPLTRVRLFTQMDDRAGYYAGGELRLYDRLVLRGLHYDNRADPQAHDQSLPLPAFAWQTRFDSAGLRAEGNHGLSFIAQWLHGQTYIEPIFGDLLWKFDARFGLLSQQLGAHRVSVRYDSFDVDAADGAATTGVGTQHGHAWTLAYIHDAGAHWRFSLEWLRVWSDSVNRTVYLGQPAYARETQLQLGVRYALRSSLN